MKSTAKFAIFIGIATIGGCFRSSDTPQPLPAVEYDIGPELALSTNETELRITPEETSSADKISLPDDIPVFTGGSFTLAEHSPTGEFATYHVSASVDEVRRFYTEQFSTGDWQVDDEIASGGSAVISATKAGRKLTLLLDVDETGTNIAISHQRNPTGG